MADKKCTMEEVNYIRNLLLTTAKKPVGSSQKTVPTSQDEIIRLRNILKTYDRDDDE